MLSGNQPAAALIYLLAPNANLATAGDLTTEMARLARKLELADSPMASISA
jgi:hypothetical protein